MLFLKSQTKSKDYASDCDDPTPDVQETVEEHNFTKTKKNLELGFHPIWNLKSKEAPKRTRNYTTPPRAIFIAAYTRNNPADLFFYFILIFKARIILFTAGPLAHPKWRRK